MKGLRINYRDAEALSGIWRFILKYIQNLNKILYNLKKAELTVTEVKSQWCMSEIDVVSFMCDSKKCHPDSVKILKIVEWSLCALIIKVKVFIEVYMYYWI